MVANCPTRAHPLVNKSRSAVPRGIRNPPKWTPSGLLFDDGVIDRGAEAFVEDFDAVELGTGAGPVLVGPRRW